MNVDMNALLLDLLARRCQVRFTQSSAWPQDGKGEHTKCWVRLEGHGDLAESEWCDSPAAALVEAHGRALAALGVTR